MPFYIFMWTVEFEKCMDDVREIIDVKQKIIVLRFW